MVKLEAELGSALLFGMSSRGQKTELDVILAKYGLRGCRCSISFEAESAIPRNRSSTDGDDDVFAVPVDAVGSGVVPAVTSTVEDGRGVGVQVKSTSRTKIEEDDDDDGDDAPMSLQEMLNRPDG